jgi:hypothetical protein
LPPFCLPCLNYYNINDDEFKDEEADRSGRAIPLPSDSILVKMRSILKKDLKMGMQTGVAMLFLCLLILILFMR